MTPASFIQTLDKNTSEILAVLDSIPETEIAVKYNDKWGIAEQLEHIYLTEKLVLFIVSRPTNNVSEHAELIGNEKLQRVIVGLRKRKIEAPERLKPKGDITSAAAFREVFLLNRTALKEGLTSGKIVIDRRKQNHPILGEMTMQDWLNFIIHHTQRHIEQIKDLYPQAGKGN